ncbi:uncharacterized protein [Palaemon carinicauda]|uniref:uncharacterized protein n=1 Tax=Palaemon carinicauda TaxID=392227 RepID=UPI0035B67575
MASAVSLCSGCGLCVRSRQEALICDGCNKWRHRLCGTKISQFEYRNINRRLKAGQVFMRCCPDCPDWMEVSCADADDPSDAFPVERKPATINNTPKDFNIILPIDNITPFAETSLVDEALPTTILADTPVTYKIVSGGTRKCSSLLADSLGFTYTRKRESSVSVTWICSYRGKKYYATISQQLGTMNFKSGHHQHTHPGDPGAELKASTRAFVKKSALECSFASSGEIVKKELSSCENSDVPLPNINTLFRCNNRARGGQRPKHPEDTSFELNRDHVPQDFLQADLSENGQRHLIFATSIQLQHMSKSKTWYVDGTFKLVRTPFVQLLSVHSSIKRSSERIILE